MKQPDTAIPTEPVTSEASLPPIDEAELRALVERPCKGYLWGQEYDISPRVIGKVFGDGRRLISITPLTTRPEYFVVRVDSAEDFEIRDILDDIYEAGDEEYGCYNHLDEDQQNDEAWPIVDWGFGTCWGDRYTIEELRSDHRESAAVQP